MWIELAIKSSAIHIQAFENHDHALDRNAEVLGPLDDVKIFLAFFHPLQDSVEEGPILLKFTKQEAEIVIVELHPIGAAVQVLDPARPKETVPVLMNPVFDADLAQVAALFL